jgi:periplasmic divalent cation tolerance protein
MTEIMVALCSCPDEAVAQQLARALVRLRLAACVNIVPKIRSIYRWRDEVQDEGESLMIIKTTRVAYAELQSWLQQNHPYDVPEVLALSVQDGSADYLEWVLNETETR